MCDIVNNNIQWNPGTSTAAIQELENWSGSPILWSGEVNWVADNKLFGNCYEFLKASSSGSITGTLLSNQTSAVTTAQHSMLTRTRDGSVNVTSFNDESNNSTFNFNDLGVSTITAQSSSPSHNISAPAGNTRSVNFLTGTTSSKFRWQVCSNGAAESGSNTGSDFVISRYDDTGTFIDSPFSISRATGVVLNGTIASVSKFFDSYADTFNGTATSSGTAITWVSGQVFDTTMVGLNFTFNGGLYTISAYIDSHHVTLSTSAGTVSSATSFYIGNAFQTSTGNMQITSGGWGLFQVIACSTVFNSRADVFGGNAFQTSTGTCFITGAGNAAFQSVAMNFMDIVGNTSDQTAPSSGTARLEYNITSGTLKYNLGGAGWVNFGGLTIPGSSNTQVMVSNGTALTGSANLVFGSGILTASSGMVAPVFNATATGTSIAFQVASFYAWNGQGDISVRSQTIGNQGAALIGVSGSTLVSATSTGLYASISGGTPILISSGGGTVAGSNTQLQYNNSGAFGASSALTFSSGILTVGSGAGTGVVAPLFNANAGSTNLEFQGSNFSVTGQGHIATNGWLDFGNASAPSTVSSHNLLYGDNSGLHLSTNNAAFDLIATQTYVNTAYTAGTGVSITSGSVSIGQSVATSSNVQFAGVTTTAEANVGSSVTGASYAFQSGGGSASITGAGNAGFQSVTVTNDFVSLATGTNLCFSSPNVTINGNGLINCAAIVCLGGVQSGNASFAGQYYITDSSHTLQTGYTGSVASAAGRNVVGGIIV